MSRHGSSLDRTYFDALYATDPDPWRFATSDYEREKYAASIAALPHAYYEDALEVGCSIGIFTKILAERCRRLLALDVAEKALLQARQNCRSDHVIFENKRIPVDWPKGSFDLIVLSEVLYYLDKSELSRAAACARDSIRTEGAILLVHYLGETNYPLTGDEAADSFIAMLPFPLHCQHRTEAYRLDVLKT